MYRTLVPVDTGEDRALEQAKYVASLPDAAESVEAIVLFVFGGESEELPEELRRFDSATRIGSVKRVVEYLEERGVAVEVHEKSGDTTEDILREAENADVDAVVLGGRKRSPAGKVLFGSVAQSVILRADRPVVVTGGQEG